MKTESEIRQMLAILSAFNQHGERGGMHDLEIRALMWVLGEYPPQTKITEEVAESIKESFRVRQPSGPGGFPVRGVPTNPKPKESE